MKKIEIEACGDFCDNCHLFEIESITFNANFAPYMRVYKCKNYDICLNAIKLFAKSKGFTVAEEPKEDDWMEDQI